MNQVDLFLTYLIRQARKLSAGQVNQFGLLV
jgi:hypothetical protein